MQKQNNETPKKRYDRSTLLRIGKYIFEHKWLLILSLIMTFVSNIFSLLGPRLSGFAIDAIELGQGKVNFEIVLYYAKWMFIFYIISAVFNYLLTIIMIRISRQVTYNIRKDLFEKLTRLPVSFFDTHPAGDIISRMSYDIDTLNTSLSTDLVQILASSITIIGSFLMMVSISKQLVLIFVVTIPLSLLITRYITTRTRPLFRLRNRKLGELNGYAEEMITGQKTIKAYNREDDVIHTFDESNVEAVNAHYNSVYYSSMTGASIGFINNLSLTLISIFGALMYMGGGITVGNISSFVLYSRRFSGPIHEIANIYSELQSALAAAERVFRILDEEEEKPDMIGAIDLEDVQGNVDIVDVDFRYVEDKPVLQNFNLEANKGDLIAIVGPTGAGKTTLINLLMRFYDVDSGTICVDGKSIYDVSRKSLRGAYSMVLQDTWVFYGTIYENISYGRPEATLEEVIEVAKVVNLHNYIMRLPDGYDTVLTDDGANISKGQMQLLTIARAMFLDSSMLILDEATSNVDTRTEIQIQKAMRELMKGKTSFVVAHRLSTIQNADNILVVRDGNVVESGTHNQLLSQRGFYWEMHNAQFT